MPRHPARNRVIAGAFILLMLAAALAVLVIVGGWESWLQETQRIRIHFAAAPNLKIGNPVLLAGHPVGHVDVIHLVPRPSPPGEEKPVCYVVEVIAEIPRTYTIARDATVVITQSLVGQSASVNIINVGVGERLEPTGNLTGEQASPFAAAADELGIGDREKKSIGEILENLRQLSAKAKTDLPDILDKMKTASTNMAVVSEQAKGTLGKVEGILDENRQNLKATIAHARSLTEKADKNAGEILDNARVASVDLKAAVADFKRIAAEGKGFMTLNKPNLNKTLQNFRTTSEHLKALAKEVRRAPWRLFARPDKKEVESLNLYDAARAFASAATDLDSLADTLRVMVEARKEGVEVDPKVLEGMLQRLEETFDRYQDAEDALWKEFERIEK